MNAGYPAAGNAEFCYPGTNYIGHGGELHSFPLDEQGRDISWYEKNDFGNSKSYHIVGKYNDFYGAYWHDNDFGSIHHADYDEKLGMKIFLWGLSREGGIWEDLLTDTNGQYIELQSGRMYNQPASNSSLTPYKHTAFGADWVVTPNEYLLKIESYTAEDVREFANTYYTAANVVLAIAGPKIPLADMKEAVAHCLGNVPAGTRQPKFNGDIYTGGFSRMDVNSGATRLMFGWDVSKLTLDDSPAANVMMSMFWRRLERAYAEAGIDAQVEFKIAGYYGLRTMRAFVMSPDADAKSLTNVLIGAVNRICDVEATEERMEKSRNAAMVEKLDKYEKSDDKALEVAWQTIGRGSMYNIANRIEEIKDIDADAVRMLSLRVFRGCRPTYIVAATPETDALSYQEVLEKLGLEDMLKDDEKA